MLMPLDGHLRSCSLMKNGSDIIKKNNEIVGAVRPHIL